MRRGLHLVARHKFLERKISYRLSLIVDYLTFLFCLLIFLPVGQVNGQADFSGAKLLQTKRLLSEGTDYLHNNKNQLAKEKLVKACLLMPDLPQAHHQLGIALSKLGEDDNAIKEFNKAVELDPNCAASLLNLAAVYQSSGNINQAKVTYQKFIDRFPKDKDLAKIKVLIVNLDAAGSGFSNIANSQNKGLSTPSQTYDINQGIENNKKAENDDYYADIVRRGAWHWSKERFPLKVFIEPANLNNGASDRYIAIMKEAFNDWSKASNGLLDFIFVSTVDKADIVCYWSKDISKFKNSSEAANTKVYAKNSLLDKGEIEILTISSNGKPISANQARATCLHEIGHINGLTGHSSNPNDVMYVSASLKDAWIELSNRDINTILHLYSNL